MVRNFLKNIFRILSALVIILTFLAYLCPQINPTSFPWLSFIGTGFPWLIFLNLAMFLFWLWRKDRFAIYHIGILALGWTYITAFMGTSLDKGTAPESSISIATHNIGSIYRTKTKITDSYREKRVNSYTAFWQENGFPDILCTQETGHTFYQMIAAKLSYPHTFNLKKGNVIFSRFPMEAGGDIPFGKSSNSIVWADIRIGSELVRIYNVHLQSNRVTSETEKIIEEGELKEEQTWGEISGILGKVGRATSVRAQQAEYLREHVRACNHKVILCGDFNDTPNSYVYRILAEGMTDTFQEKGTGLGSTFAGVLPFLRIDYILTDKKIKTYSCRRIKGDFSDHYSVFAEIGI